MTFHGKARKGGMEGVLGIQHGSGMFLQMRLGRGLHLCSLTCFFRLDWIEVILLSGCPRRQLFIMAKVINIFLCLSKTQFFHSGITHVIPYSLRCGLERN